MSIPNWFAIVLNTFGCPIRFQFFRFLTTSRDSLVKGPFFKIKFQEPVQKNVPNIHAPNAFKGVYVKMYVMRACSNFMSLCRKIANMALTYTQKMH